MVGVYSIPREYLPNCFFPVDRVEWFKSALQGSSGPLTEEELRLLTQRYIHVKILSCTQLNKCSSFIDREDAELEEARQQRRPGRPKLKAEEQIMQRKDTEEREFKAGFWVPELRDEESRMKVERWSGDWAGLNTLAFVRIVRNGPVKPSSFPPKGLS